VWGLIVFRQTEIHRAEPLVPEPSVFGAVIVVECVEIEARNYCHTICDVPHAKFFFNTKETTN